MRTMKNRISDNKDGFFIQRLVHSVLDKLHIVIEHIPVGRQLQGKIGKQYDYSIFDGNAQL